MTTKLFEIRDEATTIPAMATALVARSEEERWLLRRGGYSEEQIDPVRGADDRYIILWPLTGGVATYDPYGHQTRARTYNVAHHYIIQNWHALESGAVIDVEFILGERTEPKVSERLTAAGGA